MLSEEGAVGLELFAENQTLTEAMILCLLVFCRRNINET